MLIVLPANTLSPPIIAITMTSTGAIENTVEALLKCGAEALRVQKALLRQWEELPLTESVNLSIGIFGRCFLSDEPKRLMRAFIDRKR